MLVLSRRQGQKILFPALGISLELLRISGTTVRVGVDAPADVAVLREEVCHRSQLNSSSATEPVGEIHCDGSSALHEQLDSIARTLESARSNFKAGSSRDGRAAVARLVAEVKQLESLICPKTSSLRLTELEPVPSSVARDVCDGYELLARVLRISEQDENMAFAHDPPAADYFSRSGSSAGDGHHGGRSRLRLFTALQ